MMPPTQARTLLCPYCLESGALTPNTAGYTRAGYVCAKCNMSIPAEYAKSATTPTHLVSAVGFQGQGKTVYFASLFHSLDLLEREVWRPFVHHPIDEPSTKQIEKLLDHLKLGGKPPPTIDGVFPSPALISLRRIPTWGDRMLLIYDPGGGTFRSVNTLVRYASFVTHSSTILFFFAIDGKAGGPASLRERGRDMKNMLITYVQGMEELNFETKNQHLVIVLTMGDRLEGILQGLSADRRDEDDVQPEDYGNLWKWLQRGRIEALGGGEMGLYAERMRRTSRALRKFVTTECGATGFLKYAKDEFKSVEFCIVSALGAEPGEDDKLQSIVPKRVMDPLFWVFYKATRSYHWRRVLK